MQREAHEDGATETDAAKVNITSIRGMNDNISVQRSADAREVDQKEGGSCICKKEKQPLQSIMNI